MLAIKNKEGKLICVFESTNAKLYNFNIRWAHEHKLKIVEAEICPHCAGNVYVPKKKRRLALWK